MRAACKRCRRAATEKRTAAAAAATAASSRASSAGKIRILLTVYHKLSLQVDTDVLRKVVLRSTGGDTVNTYMHMQLLS
jgi:hypothetical protein